MRLIDAAGHGVDIRVTGYQFPDAENLAKRHSWHMVRATATCPQGSWTCRYPALTCDESPRIAAWLRSAARGRLPPAHADDPPTAPVTLAFTEPNLSLTVASHQPNAVVLHIGLDLEFSPPWQRRHAAGHPFVIHCRLTPRQLERAAAEWEQEIAPYPDSAPT